MNIDTCDKCPHVYKTGTPKYYEGKVWRCQKDEFKVIGSAKFEKRPHILSEDDIFIPEDKLPKIPEWCPLEDG